MTRPSLLRRVVLSLGLAAALAAALGQSAAAESVFYQPLNRDSSLGPQQWRQIWQQTRAQGFEAVIVQWSAYGDERFEQHDWLLASLAEAHRQGLALVIGLAADPAYFQTVLQPGWKDRFNDYWAALQRQSLSPQQRLLPRLNQLGLPVAGWSLPADLSDWDLRLSPDGGELEYSFDANAEDTGVPALIRRLDRLEIGFKDLNTRQSSLEDIFVSLVHRDGEAA